jgi:hypothetical protein
VSEVIREGGCLCGKIRYRTIGEPESVSFCHCTMCRRASGSPVVPWATFPKRRVEWLTEPPARYPSSAKAERGFCPRCGSALLFVFVAKEEWVDLTVGTFDDPDSLTPTHHIFTSTRVHWVDLRADLPSYPQGKPKD